MKSGFVQRVSVFSLILVTAVIFAAPLQAQEKQAFHAKRRAFCKQMLDHGEEAFKRGDFEKAGYYFQQAVQADPEQMAKSWFQMKSGGGESDEGAVPSAPANAPETESGGGVIMGDDEGC
jgi:hypothetical protein